MRSGTEIHSTPVEVLGEDNGVLSLKLLTRPRALIYANLFDDEGEEIIPLRVAAARTG